MTRNERRGPRNKRLPSPVQQICCGRGKEAPGWLRATLRETRRWWLDGCVDES
jgi:hypothetical protein